MFRADLHFDRSASVQVRLTLAIPHPLDLTRQYLIMLIAMTFNGYIIIAIVLGGIFGHFFSTWDTLGSSHLLDVDQMGHGYGAEPDVVAAGQTGANVSPCCQPDANKDAASVSSKSDDDSHLKSHVVTLPDHGYGNGACCV